MIKDPVEVPAQLGNVVLKGLEVLLERLVKLGPQDLLEVKALLEHVVKKVTRDKHIQGQTVQEAPGHGHILEMKNSVYHCPSDLIDKVNAIYIVYTIIDYDITGTEQHYLFSCGMDNNHHGVCFLKGEKTMRVNGVAGHPYNYMDILNFPTSYFNPWPRD